MKEDLPLFELNIVARVEGLFPNRHEFVVAELGLLPHVVKLANQVQIPVWVKHPELEANRAKSFHHPCDIRSDRLAFLKIRKMGTRNLDGEDQPEITVEHTIRLELRLMDGVLKHLDAGAYQLLQKTRSLLLPVGIGVKIRVNIGRAEKTYLYE